MVSTKQSTDTFLLKPWERIEVVVGEGSEQGVYVSRVEDINSEGVLITKPDFIGGNKLLTANAFVYVHFMRPDALYRFSARLRPIPNSNDKMIQLYNIGGVERVQRRQFVRLDMRLDLKYAPLKSVSLESGMSTLIWKDSHTANVSAGGLLMKAGNDLSKSELILIKVSKYEILGIPRLVAAICCRIVRMDEDKFAGVEFILDRNLLKYFSQNEIDLLPSQVKSFNYSIQNKIVKFIFEQQIKDRRKGLI
jgi:c-di-GMP-binding flagellar brake protein YcgR